MHVFLCLLSLLTPGIVGPETAALWEDGPQAQEGSPALWEDGPQREGSAHPLWEDGPQVGSDSGKGRGE